MFINTPIKTLFAILTLLVSNAYGQNMEPLELAREIFGKDSMPNIGNYIAGEYKGKPNGRDLQEGATTKFLLLGQTDTTAVVGMTILDSSGKGIDIYLHFRRDSLWKMTALRALAMTGMLEEAKTELEQLTPAQVDDIIAKAKKMKNPGDAPFASREDYQFELGNLKLTLELDDNIAKHFLANQAAFEHLKDLALKQLEKEKTDEENSIPLIENAKADYRKLFISSVSTGGWELGNCINFLIGGMVDNAVGYLYVKDKGDLPEMNSDRVIMLREIAEGWYIYKTT
jgi:hypothetical protein